MEFGALAICSGNGRRLRDHGGQDGKHQRRDHGSPKMKTPRGPKPAGRIVRRSD
jgi:hypothetical protein